MSRTEEMDRWLEEEIDDVSGRLNFMLGGSILNAVATVLYPMGYWFGKIKGWW